MGPVGLRTRSIPVFAIVAMLALGGTTATFAGGGPPNDDFANAIAISPADLPSFDEAFGFASSEVDEPVSECASNYQSCNGRTFATVWYSFTAPSDGSFEVDSLGSHFDAFIAAYTGPSIDALTEVSCGSDVTSFSATEGETNYIQVAGAFGDSGTLRVRLDEVGT